MTGGGSGGHITPILAVAHDIKQLEPSVEITYIGQKGDAFADIVRENAVIDSNVSVRAGKFRRYHGEGLRQLLDIETMAKNLRDAVFVMIGLWQSYWLLGKIKPDIVFVRGGFVGVPVGLAAALRRIPYITHDSDAIPSLANRIIARWASVHAVALDPKLYPYPASNTVNVGVPVSHNYRPVTDDLQKRYKLELGLEKYKQIILVTGGGLGAERINSALLDNANALLQAFPELCIVHTVGQKHETTMSTAYTKILAPAERKRVIVRDYVNDLYRYSGAADVVVARGGATNFAEFAQQGRACVIIPNPLLTGGHQVKNAEAYAKDHAIILLREKEIREDPLELGKAITGVLTDKEQQISLQRNIQAFARPDSSLALAGLLLKTATGGTDGFQAQ